MALQYHAAETDVYDDLEEMQANIDKNNRLPVRTKYWRCLLDKVEEIHVRPMESFKHRLRGFYSSWFYFVAGLLDKRTVYF